MFPGDFFPKDFFPGDYYPPVDGAQPPVPPTPKKQQAGRIVLVEEWIRDQDDEDLMFWIL